MSGQLLPCFQRGLEVGRSGSVTATLGPELTRHQRTCPFPSPGFRFLSERGLRKGLLLLPAPNERGARVLSLQRGPPAHGPPGRKKGADIRHRLWVRVLLRPGEGEPLAQSDSDALCFCTETPPQLCPPDPLGLADSPPSPPKGVPIRRDIRWCVAR